MTQFVWPAQGTPSPMIDAYLAPELRVPMRSALAQAAASEAPVVVENIVGADDRARLYDIKVRRSGHDYLVVPNEVRSADPLRLNDAVETRDAADRDIQAAENVQLRKQLARTLQELKTSAQELKCMNDEATILQ